MKKVSASQVVGPKGEHNPDRTAKRHGHENGSMTLGATSKSTVSELFIERTRTALGELMARRLDDTRLAVMMLDGLEIADRTHLVALGISTEEVKIPLGLWEARRRTQPWSRCCSPISSTAAWTPTRRSCS